MVHIARWRWCSSFGGMRTIGYKVSKKRSFSEIPITVGNRWLWDARGILCEKVRRKSVVIFLNCPKRLFERLRTHSPVTWGIRGDLGVGEQLFAECEEILTGWFSALFFTTFASQTWNKGAAGAVFLDRNALWWTPPFVGFSAKFQNLILWSNTKKRPN